MLAEGKPGVIEIALTSDRQLLAACTVHGTVHVHVSSDRSWQQVSSFQADSSALIKVWCSCLKPVQAGTLSLPGSCAGGVGSHRVWSCAGRGSSQWQCHNVAAAACHCTPAICQSSATSAACTGQLGEARLFQHPWRRDGSGLCPCSEWQPSAGSGLPEWPCQVRCSDRRLAVARVIMQWRRLHMLPLHRACHKSPDLLQHPAGFLRELKSWTLRLGSQPTTSGPALRDHAAACPGGPPVTGSQPCCAPGLMQVRVCPCNLQLMMRARTDTAY